MGVAALAALFQALGQAPGTDGAARDRALGAAISGCVEQAAAAALGRAPTPRERGTVYELLAEARSLVDSFRVLDEGEGGGMRFAFVEADVALGRLMPRLLPRAPQPQARLEHEAGLAVPVRGTGIQAASVRARGVVLIDGNEVGRIDRTAWGFGPSAADALADAQRKVDEMARGESLAFAAAAGPSTALWVSVRGITQPQRALPLRAAIAERVPAVRTARLIRAGAGGADLLVETELSAAELAQAIESAALQGFTLAAQSTPGGEVAVRVLP